MGLNDSIANYLENIKPSYDSEVEPCKTKSNIIIPHFGEGTTTIENEVFFMIFRSGGLRFEYPQCTPSFWVRIGWGSAEDRLRIGWGSVEDRLMERALNWGSTVSERFLINGPLICFTCSKQRSVRWSWVNQITRIITHTISFLSLFSLSSKLSSILKVKLV